jgi:hypothetical protein
LINYIQVSYWLAIAFAIASLFYFRIKMPDAPRPIKVRKEWDWIPKMFLGLLAYSDCLFRWMLVLGVCADCWKPGGDM